MRDIFSEYYAPTNAEFDRLWRDAIFVLDTSILLRIYEYGKMTRELLFQILDKLGELERLWIPYQVGKEYQENRLGVIAKQFQYYEVLGKRLSDALNALDSAKRIHHPVLDSADIIKPVQNVISKILKKVKKAKDNHPNYYDDDPLCERLTQLLQGKVGKPTPPVKLTEIYKEGERRYKAEIPPGFKKRWRNEVIRSVGLTRY